LTGQLAKPRCLAMAHCSGAALHRLGRGQVFVVDHRLQRCTGALFGCSDGGISFA
jgi:hypothetical protein